MATAWAVRAHSSTCCHPAAGKSSRTSFAQPRPATVAMARSVICKSSHVDGPLSSSQQQEWPMNWRIPSFEDLSRYFQKEVLKNQAQESALLEDVMSRQIICVTQNIALDALSNTFKKVSGVCVVDEEKRLIGVVSRKDLKERQGATVSEVMSSPPVACKADATVRDAAALMLKHKVHRIPVVDNDARVVGMVTRTDIFKALEQGK